MLYTLFCFQIPKPLHTTTRELSVHVLLSIVLYVVIVWAVYRTIEFAIATQLVMLLYAFYSQYSNCIDIFRRL